MKKNNGKNQVRVSVGLSVFNEEKNIRRILQEILKQKKTGWRLLEILVYNDGSTDNTLSEIKKIKSELIHIADYTIREGKTLRLSHMFKNFKGDVLTMFDGDVHLADREVITKLVSVFKDSKVMLAGGNSMPLTPKSFFEKSVYSTFSVFYRSRKEIKKGNNIFGCTGSILAIRNYLAREINFPKIINEDAYIYFDCIKKGFKFRYVDKAKVLYKLPTNLSDHIKQVFRSTPEAVDIELKKYFGDLVNREFKRPLRFYLKSIFITFLESPIHTGFIIFVNMVCKPFYGLVSKRYKLSWFTATSTH